MLCRVLKMDRIPQRAGGQENIENLQLLCAHCNRVKGDRPQEYLVARLRELGICGVSIGDGNNESVDMGLVVRTSYIRV